MWIIIILLLVAFVTYASLFVFIRQFNKRAKKMREALDKVEKTNNDLAKNLNKLTKMLKK